MRTPDPEVEAALARIREDATLVARYDVTGDGELDEREWELVRRMVELELRTAAERNETWSLEAEPQVLNDRFEVIGLLGRGGQAFTHLARDRKNDNKHVVVKELSIHVAADWKSIQLFEREAEVLERLTHLRVPRYVDAFHVDDEVGNVRFMLVQDFVDGHDLGHFVKDGGRWTEEEALRRMIEVCGILDYLHNKSPAVIHRDLKPSNLIVGRDDHLYLVDFGAVQTVVPTTVGGSTIIGTSGYVPMEQYMGQAEPASDIYALAATAVHLICGEHPADLPFKRGRLQIDAHLNVSRKLIDLLQQMLVPDVEARPQPAAELGKRLAVLLNEADHKVDESEPRSLDSVEQPDVKRDMRRRAGILGSVWTIESTPSGALIEHPKEGELGRTPAELVFDEYDLPIQLTLRLDGHKDSGVTLRDHLPRRVQVTLHAKHKPISKLPRGVIAPAKPQEVVRQKPPVRPSNVPRIIDLPHLFTLSSGASLSGLMTLELFVGIGVIAIFAPIVAAVMLVPTLVLMSTVLSGSRLVITADGWEMNGRSRWSHKRGEVVAVNVGPRQVALVMKGGERAVMDLRDELSRKERISVRDQVVEGFRRHHGPEHEPRGV